MKHIKTVLLISILFVGMHTKAQNAPTQKVEIQTSAICGICKKTIETAVKKVDGVQTAVVDNKTKIATVEFDGSKTNSDAIKKAINNAGYDADDSPANKTAYNKLESCCKKEDE